MRKKVYVLDTSVLLSAPNAIHQFVEHEVVIPLVVITELEAKRTHVSLGFPAREALRAIEAVSERGDINHGVKINDHGGTVRIEMNHIDQSGLPDAVARASDNDARILAVAFNLANGDAKVGEAARDVTVVSKDMPMRLKAKVLGLGAEPYRNEMVVVERPYTGIEEIEVSPAVIDGLYDQGSLDIDEARLATPEGGEVLTNTGVRLISSHGSAIGIVGADKSLTVIAKDREAFGVRGKSLEQKIALAHLTNPDVGVVSLGGPAGTGKTYLALAAGLEQVLETSTFKKVVVFRPLFAVGGQDLGYLPGSADEKMSPWGAAVFDALASMTSKDVVDEIVAREMLEVLPLTHIRGRTLNDAFIIVDEAQNLERPVLLTALSRLGANAKVALSWDVAQRDNSRVGRYDGIAAVVERLKGNPLFAHTTLTKSERGPVAAMVTTLLDDMVN
nr:PhoH family protein [Nocardioides sp. Leaf285]